MKKAFFLVFAVLFSMESMYAQEGNLVSTSRVTFASAPTGAVNHKALFTVQTDESGNPTLKVYFSKGNLQYDKDNDEWKFAEHQYDYIGATDLNKNPAGSYSGSIDLFGWGRSGCTMHGTSDTAFTPLAYQNLYVIKRSTIGGTNCDWGVYNPITNGGNMRGHWRALSKEEWQTLLNRRQDDHVLYTHAIVTKEDGTTVKGELLFPDDWNCPNGITINSWASTSFSQTFTNDEWKLLEASGVVFLPACGYRAYSSATKASTTYSNAGSATYYWTCTSYNSTSSYACVVRLLSGSSFSVMSTTGNTYYKSCAYPVRLVQNAPLMTKE